jgi:hypothetical protein
VKTYHVEILDDNDEPLTQADVAVEKVGDIQCVRSEDFVGILVKGETVATGYLTIEQASRAALFTALRWLNGEGDPVEVTVER